MHHCPRPPVPAGLQTAHRALLHTHRAQSSSNGHVPSNGFVGPSSQRQGQQGVHRAAELLCCTIDSSSDHLACVAGQSKSESGQQGVWQNAGFASYLQVRITSAS